MDDYLSKPVRRELLATALEAAAIALRGRDGDRGGAGADTGATGPAPERDTPADGDDTAPVLDARALAELLETVGDDPAFVSEVVDTYLADAPRQVEAMRSALAAGDLTTLGRAAHTLKGNSRDLGATALAEIARGLEERARAGDATDAGPQIEAAAAQLERVAAALERARATGWKP
jgi:HPt (histidine-containing phosphotransfer) domain-containing protein